MFLLNKLKDVDFWERHLRDRLAEPIHLNLISIFVQLFGSFRAKVAFDLVERHPDGSQAFLPMSEHPFLVIVAPDEGGVPGAPQAFLTDGAQGINLLRGTWHGVLTPLSAPGLFAVVDRIGTTPNLEEYRYQKPWTVVGA